MLTYEVLRLKRTGREYPLAEVTWGGSITAGVPKDIVDSRSSALSGTAKLSLYANSFASPNPAMYPGLDVGETVVLEAHQGEGAPKASIEFILTTVRYTHDSVSVSFSTDALALSNLVRTAPLAKHMPPGWGRGEGDTSEKWASRLGEVYALSSPLSVVHAAFRVAGYNCVPPIDTRSTMIDLPLQWAAIPDAWSPHGGHAFSATGARGGDTAPSLVPDGGMTYLTDGAIWVGTTLEGNRSWGDDIADISGHVMVGQQSAGEMHLTLIFGGGNWVVIRVFANRSVLVESSHGSDSRSPDGAMNGVETVRFSISRTSKTWRVKAGSATLSGTFDPPKTEESGYHNGFSGLRLVANPGAKVAGLQVRNVYSADSHYLDKYEGDVPKTQFISAPLSGMDSEATPSVRDRVARDLLDDIAEALCASWWVDEAGVARFEDMEALQASSARRAYQIDRDVSAYELEARDTAGRDHITVKYSQTAYARNQQPRVDLYTGRGATLEEGDTYEEFVEAPRTHDWFGVDWSASFYHRGKVTPEQARAGSWVGTTVRKGKGSTSQRLRRVTPWVGKFEARLVNPTEGYEVVYEMDGQKYPLVRGRGVIEYTDTSTSYGSSTATKPHVIEAGQWITTKTVADRVGAFLLGMSKATAPMVSLTVVYSPGLRLGDTIMLSEGDHSVVRRRLLVLSLAHKPGENTTQIDVLEISATDTTPYRWRNAQSWARNNQTTYGAVQLGTNAKSKSWRTVQSNPENSALGL